MRKALKTNRANKTTLFFDPFHEGHRLSHAEALLAVAEKMPENSYIFALHETLIVRLKAQPRWAALDKANIKLVSLQDRVARSVKANNKDIAGGWRTIMLAQSLALEHECTHLHFLHLDTVILALFFASFGKLQLPISGMYMCPTEHYHSIFGEKLSRSERVFALAKKWIVGRLLSCRRITAIHVFDEFAPTFYANHGNAHKILAIPDFAPMPSTEKRPEGMRAWQGKPNRFSLFGAIDPRKGIFPLIEGLRLLDPEEAKTVSVTFMGRVHEDIKIVLDKQLTVLQNTHPELSITVVDRFVDDEEILWLCQHSTAIMMPYQRHRGSSGVLCWAAHADVPVLTQSFGLVGREVEKYDLGLTVDSESPTEIASGIKALLRKAPVHACEQRFLYGQRHTPGEFARETLDKLTP